MEHELVCYRCGGSLASLSLPLSRRDECPHCQNYVHVCKMCRFFDPAVPRQCREDDAEDVKEKERPNFCDYFTPDENAFDPSGKHAADQAVKALDALFGGGSGEGTDGDSAGEPSDAEKLFRQ